MDILLYLCSGGRSWDSQLAGASAPAGGAAATGQAAQAAHRGSTEAGLRAASSNGLTSPLPGKDAEASHASASPRDAAPAEAAAAAERASTTDRDGTLRADAAAGLSEEVGHGLLQTY